jgi:hypothetical protein
MPHEDDISHEETSAELGFAHSEVVTVQGGSKWIVPANLHSPVRTQFSFGVEPTMKRLKHFLHS